MSDVSGGVPPWDGLADSISPAPIKKVFYLLFWV
jgi:hypothetical protein